MGSEHLQRLDVSWGHEPGRRLQSGTGFQPVSPEQAGCLCHFLRFMGSLHDPRIAHWDHEPLRLTEARSGPRVSDPQPPRSWEAPTSNCWTRTGTMNGGARLRPLDL